MFPPMMLGLDGNWIPIPSVDASFDSNGTSSFPSDPIDYESDDGTPVDATIKLPTSFSSQMATKTSNKPQHPAISLEKTPAAQIPVHNHFAYIPGSGNICLEKKQKSPEIILDDNSDDGVPLDATIKLPSFRPDDSSEEILENSSEEILDESSDGVPLDATIKLPSSRHMDDSNKETIKLPSSY